MPVITNTSDSLNVYSKADATGLGSSLDNKEANFSTVEDAVTLSDTYRIPYGISRGVGVAAVSTVSDPFEALSGLAKVYSSKSMLNIKPKNAESSRNMSPDEVAFTSKLYSQLKPMVEHATAGALSIIERYRNENGELTDQGKSLLKQVESWISAIEEQEEVLRSAVTKVSSSDEIVRPTTLFDLMHNTSSPKSGGLASAAEKLFKLSYLFK